jgi:hypothetical protein
MTHRLGHVRGAAPRSIGVPALGRNSRQSIGQLAWSVAAWMLTPTWQLATLPSVPEYCRATPTEAVPNLGKPVSSMIQASGSTAAVIRVARAAGAPAASPRGSG